MGMEQDLNDDRDLRTVWTELASSILKRAGVKASDVRSISISHSAGSLPVVALELDRKVIPASSADIHGK